MTGPAIARAATHNVLVTLDRDATERALAAVLDTRPSLVGLQEWGANRAHLLPTSDYDWARPGSMPVGVRREDGAITGSQRLVLAGPRDGVRTTYATEAEILAADGRKHVVLNVHLIAHHDRPENHAAWKDGRNSITRWAMEWGRHDPSVQRWVMGDVNKHDLVFPVLTSCWRGGRPLATFGDRSIDGIWTDVAAHRAWVVRTPSDHHAVVTDYDTGKRRR